MPSSTLLGVQATDTGHMIDGRVQAPLENSPSSLGDSSVEVIGQGVVVEAEVLPLVFTNPVSTQIINDNYCASPT